MSRSGYTDECDNLELYRNAVDRAIRGKRGQAFLREMAAALDAMPIKELVPNELVRHDGQACALGAVALARGLDTATIDDSDPDEVASRFGIARSLAAEIAYENDDDSGWADDETPAHRWKRMREWVDDHLYPPSPEVIARRMAKLAPREP